MSRIEGYARESLKGPWRVEAYDNMADAYCVEGNVSGEEYDEYPHDDETRHAVRAEAIQAVPEMLSLLESIASDTAGFPPEYAEKADRLVARLNRAGKTL